MIGAGSWVLVWILMNLNSAVAYEINQYAVDSLDDCNTKILEITTEFERAGTSLDSIHLYCVPPDLKPNKYDMRRKSIKSRRL